MITGIILASGFSKRMGEDKLLMNVKGKQMVEWVIIASKKSSLDRILLIYRSEKVKEVGEIYNIETIFNPKAPLGQSEAMKLGVRKAIDSDAYMFLLADQPFINPQLIDKLIDQYKKNRTSILVPYYNGQKGTPTIFPSVYKNELLKIQGDKGGRDIIRKNPASIVRVDIYEEKMGFDIDSPGDFEIISDKINPYNDK
ncbi:MAG: nucleotidyltransferase family protein [Tissierellia bacterium]|nr:nucleotidyltransferase family protein [Tissierellia bacterium]